MYSWKDVKLVIEENEHIASVIQSKDGVYWVRCSDRIEAIVRSEKPFITGIGAKKYETEIYQAINLCQNDVPKGYKRDENSLGNVKLMIGDGMNV